MDSLIFLIIIGVLLAFVIGIYNRLVKLRNQVRSGFAQIDVELTRRHDLIPNLVASVQGYMKHERETLDAVVAARNAATKDLKRTDPTDPVTIKNLATAEATLSSGLGKLFALMENYPDLKANQNMLNLQDKLSATENTLAFSRQAFNDAVMTYNTACESFPASVFAGFFGFSSAGFFRVDSAEVRDVPDVSFT